MATTPLPAAATETDTPGPICPMCDGAGQVDGDASWSPLLSACHVLVLRALERAGRRLLTRQLRGLHRDVPAHLLHTRIPPDPSDLAKLMEGAWDAVPDIVDEWGCCGTGAQQVTRVLDRYVRELLVAQYPHEVRSLRFSLGAVVRPG